MRRAKYDPVLSLVFSVALALPSLGTSQVPASTSTQAASRGASTTTTTAALGALVAAPTSTRAGPLGKDEIQAVIRANLPRFKYCYERRLVDHPALEGEVTVRFRIGDQGSVVQAMIAKTTMGDVDVETCLGRVMRTLRFRPIRPGHIIDLTYPFKFRSDPGDAPRKRARSRRSSASQ